MAGKAWLSLNEVAEQLSVSTRTVRRWIAEGRMSARRAGPRLIRVHQSEIDKLMGVKLNSY